MLTDTTLAGAELILARGVANDTTFPTQAVYLARTSDPDRSVRFIEFDNAMIDGRIRRDIPGFAAPPPALPRARLSLSKNQSRARQAMNDPAV